MESKYKTSYVTEEFDGWQVFINQMLSEFPQIDKDWITVITKPAFKRNETELYYRSGKVSL
jgi:hypothetical protein